MTIADRAVLVTGANRGIGQALVEEALRRGAKRVYAGTRQPLTHPDGRVTPLTLDVTSAAQIQAAAGKVESLDILINNAGVALYDDLSDRAALEQQLAVNLFGTYGVTQAFLPLLIRSRGAIVNNLSLNAFAPMPVIPAYSISKAAAFNLTQSLRALLAGRGVRVHAVLTGPTDTDMTRGFDIPKASRGVGRASHLRRSGERGGGHLPRSPVTVRGRELAQRCGQGARAPARGARSSRAGQGISKGEGLGPEPEGGHLAMKTPPIVSPQEWEAARQQLLVKEKDVTRARDALAAERRRMPWLAVEKEYEFDGPKGKASLLDLFEGRRQLIVYRAFFEPGVYGWPDHACRGCSLVADQVAHVAHLNARDTTLAFASRAPQPDIERVKARMGWKMPWYTMTDGFDTDFGVDEWHGTNAFIRDGDSVFRTYFINNRGDEAMGSTWSYLDLTALGRQEDWEDSPEGYPQTPPYAWWNWHDEYGDAT